MAALYDPNLMPRELSKAHAENDKAVMRAGQNFPMRYILLCIIFVFQGLGECTLVSKSRNILSKTAQGQSQTVGSRSGLSFSRL